MNTKTVISILIVILVGGGVWYWQSKTTTSRNGGQEQRYTDPATLKPGDQFGVFTVESVSKDEYGDWRVQLRGEKVVKGRLVASNPFNEDLEGGRVCFRLEEAGDEPITPAFSSNFCLPENIKADSFYETQIPEDKKNSGLGVFMKIKISDPIVWDSQIEPDTATLLEIISIANSPDEL